MSILNYGSEDGRFSLSTLLADHNPQCVWNFDLQSCLQHEKWNALRHRVPGREKVLPGIQRDYWNHFVQRRDRAWEVRHLFLCHTFLNLYWSIDQTIHFCTLASMKILRLQFSTCKVSSFHRYKMQVDGQDVKLNNKLEFLLGGVYEVVLVETEENTVSDFSFSRVQILVQNFFEQISVRVKSSCF